MSIVLRVSSDRCIHVCHMLNRVLTYLLTYLFTYSLYSVANDEKHDKVGRQMKAKQNQPFLIIIIIFICSDKIHDAKRAHDKT